MPTKPKIALVTCATENYTYAFPAFLRAISRNIYHLQKIAKVKADIKLFIVGDATLQQDAVQREIGLHFNDQNNVQVEVFTANWTEGENYQKHAQLTIAQMRTKTFELARAWGADYCWSLDSDVLVPDNGLACALQVLAFDNGYYSIACCPYPSQGGGSFMTGFGDRFNPIYADFNLDEREVSDENDKEWQAINKRIGDEPENVSLHKERFELRKKIEKESPPIHNGNIWKLISEKGWRPRGWFDYAYPAIGRGAIVPVTWCGFGATLMNAEALAAADFTGYDGGGTEDLYICYQRWAPRRLKLGTLAHVPCDHIVRTGATKKLVHCRTYHEEHKATEGHLRREFRPWYQHNIGEQFDEKNDGKPDNVDQLPDNPTKQRKRTKALKRGK